MQIRTRFKISSALVAGLLLTACQPEKAPSPETQDDPRPVVPANVNPDDAAQWTLACNNGQTLVVTFDHERQMVTVRRSDGLAFDLVRRTVSQGYLFTASGVQLSGNGKDAQWSAPPVSDTQCRVSQVRARNQHDM